MLFVLLVSPCNDCFKEGMVCCLCLGLTHLKQKVKLLAGVFKLVLLDLAVDHTIQRGLVCLIALGCLLINTIGILVISKHCFLVCNFRLEVSIVWLKCNSFFKHLGCLLDDLLSSSTVS